MRHEGALPSGERGEMQEPSSRKLRLAVAAMREEAFPYLRDRAERLPFTLADRETLASRIRGERAILGDRRTRPPRRGAD